VQPGGPPFWIGAASEPALRRGARWAAGVAGFSLGPDPAEVAAGFRLAERLWSEAGRPAPPRRVTSFSRRSACGPTRCGYLALFGERPAQALAARCAAAGAAAVRERLAALRDAGADEVLLVPTEKSQGELERTLDLVG
jgi:alkanesulfonate monooxygenase SsuD/methylene tetrahydromethanopterin reductase-like flavin-dependent oxidoreductase (luciferase family)